MTKYKWNFNHETDILDGAVIPSCINKNNKDPNLIKSLNFEKSSTEEILNEAFSSSDFDQKLFENGTFFKYSDLEFELPFTLSLVTVFAKIPLAKILYKKWSRAIEKSQTTFGL